MVFMQGKMLLSSLILVNCDNWCFCSGLMSSFNDLATKNKAVAEKKVTDSLYK